jgi:hypothetical protein
MSYTDIYSRKDVRIPTWLSFVAVLFTVFLISIVFFRSEPPSSKATKKTVQRVEITNLSSSQTAIFWQTEQKEAGWIVYGTSDKSFNQIAIDERDFQNNKTPRLTHYAILKNLTPSTNYYFKLVNNKELITDPEGNPFIFTTLQRTSQVSNLKPSYGKVTDASGAPLENVIVLLSIKNSFSLSTLSKSSGEWLIPLNYLIDKKTDSLKTISKDELIKIEFFSDTGHDSTVRTVIPNLSPLSQTIVLGKDYDLTVNNKENVLAASDSKVEGIDILFPKEDAIIPGGNPLIRGTGIPQADVTAMVSDEKRDITLKTKVGGDGTWNLTLTNTLSAGRHSLTLRTNDTQGKEKLLTRNFSIAKSGEQVLGEATGAATPTASPSPASIVAVSTTPSPPITGGNISFLTFSSLSLITVGMWLLVFTL